MVYYNPLKNKLAVDDFSLFLLPFSVTLCITSLKRSNKLNIEELRRKIKQLNESSSFKITLITFFARMYSSNDRRAIPVPARVSWCIYLVEGISPITKHCFNDTLCVWRNLNERDIYSFARKIDILWDNIFIPYWKFFYKPMLKQTGVIIIANEGLRWVMKLAVSKACNNLGFWLNLGNFKCWSSPYKPFVLVILSILLGSKISSSVSQKRSMQFATISGSIFIFLSATKFRILGFYPR